MRGDAEGGAGMLFSTMRPRLGGFWDFPNACALGKFLCYYSIFTGLNLSGPAMLLPLHLPVACCTT